jgi:hypothetical protein
MMRFALWTLGLTVVGIVGAAGAGAVTRHPTPAATSRPTPKPVAAQPIAAQPVAAALDSTLLAAAAPAIQQGTPMSLPTPIADSSRHASTIAAATAAAWTVVDSARPPAKPAIAPILPQGRSDLHDSLFAVRTGDTVVVHFDTAPTRTRRADKFEAIVRQTLRVVYGPLADTLLAGVKDGKLAPAKELLTLLPARGIHLQGPKGLRVALWPETRPGQNGPLVIAYRTTIEH